THTAFDEPSTSHAVSAAASAVTPSAVSAYAPHARITAPSRAPRPAAPRRACAPARAPSRDGGTCNRIPLPHRSRPPAAGISVAYPSGHPPGSPARGTAPSTAPTSCLRPGIGSLPPPGPASPVSVASRSRLRPVTNSAEGYPLVKFFASDSH